MIRTTLLKTFFCCFGLLAIAFGQAAGNTGNRRAPGGGIDLAGQDTSIRPGDDFFLYANGHYLDKVVIPPDRSVYSTASILTDSVEAKLRSMLTDAARQESSGSVGRMADDYYAAFMNELQIERLGIAPLLPELKAIQAADSRKALASLMGRANASLFGSIFHLDISADLKDPEHYAIQISQPYLNLPLAAITLTRVTQSYGMATRRTSRSFLR